MFLFLQALSRYNLLAVELIPLKSWVCHDGLVLYPPSGEVLLKFDLAVEEDVCDVDDRGAVAVTPGDWALLRAQVCGCVCVWVCVFVHTHTHTHTYTYLYIYLYIYIYI